MKNVSVLFTTLCLVFVLNACKKDAAKPEVTSTTTTSLTINDLLAGKWAIVKDSVQTFDFRDRISNFQNLVFSNGNFVIFNKDHSGAFSSQGGFDALYTDYGRLVINPDGPAIVPNLKFNYQVAEPVASSPPTLYIPNITATSGVTYSIARLTSTDLILHYEINIAKYPHDYVVKEDIYLSK